MPGFFLVIVDWLKRPHYKLEIKQTKKKSFPGVTYLQLYCLLAAFVYKIRGQKMYTSIKKQIGLHIAVYNKTFLGGAGIIIYY